VCELLHSACQVFSPKEAIDLTFFASTSASPSDCRGSYNIRGLANQTGLGKLPAIVGLSMSRSLRNVESLIDASAERPSLSGDEFGEGFLRPCSPDHMDRVFTLFGPLLFEILPHLLQ
jgi:hypothetical protein